MAAGVTETGARPQVTVAFTGVIAQDKPTVALKLFNEVTAINEVVEFPAAVVAEAGAAVILKSFTVNANVVVRFCPPDDPVTVAVYVPTAVPVVVETVKVDVAIPFATGVTEVKLKPQDIVALTGAIAQVNPTAALKLFDDVTVIVDVVEFPASVVAEIGTALILKLLTVRV